MLAPKAWMGWGGEVLGTLLRRIRVLNCDPPKDYPKKRQPEMTGLAWASPGCRGAGDRAEQQSLGGWGNRNPSSQEKKKKEGF